MFQLMNTLILLQTHWSLSNLNSGLPVESEIATGILRIKEKGEEQYHTLIDNRIKTAEVKIHEPITRNKLLLLKNACKKVEVIKNNKHQLVEINGNILGKLLVYLAKSGRAIDFQTALQYPLSSERLAFTNPDGTRRNTKKSQLMEIMLSYVNDLPDYSDVRIQKEQIAAYLVDLMALIRALPGVCDTYEELAQKVFDALPVGYQRIDIVADSYRENSLKNLERTKRGCSKRVLIHSSKSKVPSNFADFLKIGENKTRLIELIKNELVKKRQSVLQKLRCHETFFLMGKLCLRITVNTTDIIEELREEADTELLLHAKHTFNSTENQAVLVRSPSGVLDINVLFIALFPEKAD